jgi:glycosyltransferase involved in cell wall biosynthesis
VIRTRTEGKLRGGALELHRPGPMRLVYIIDSLFPGGAARSLAAMVPHLVSSGVELDVAYLVERPGLHDELERAGARVVPATGSSSRLARSRRVTRIVRRSRPDLIHTTLFEADIAGRIAGRLAGVPVVSSIVNLAYGPEQLADPRLKRWRIEGARLVDVLTARRVVRFHALSRHVAEVMGERLRIPLERIDVVARGRDPDRLGKRTEERRAEARARIGAQPGDVVLLAAARQEHQKGLDVLLDAFPMIAARIPGARLVLAGRPGGATPSLQERAAAAGPRVRILGTRDDVPDLMCGADVLAVPSRWEGLGCVLLEGMALEAPIVASDLPAVREVLDDGSCGLLVPPERPDRLAAGIVKAARDGDASRHRAVLARRRFQERYTDDRVAGEMLAFYERAFSQAASGRATRSRVGA